MQTITPVVHQLRGTDSKDWTDFVTKHPESNLYHTLTWCNVIEEAFGHKPFYLICREGTNICGVLPMFLVRFPLLGSKLISLPYDIGSGGVLANDEIFESTLVNHAMAMANKMRVNYLELRYGTQRNILTNLGLQKKEPVIVSQMELDTEEQVWARIKPDHRRAIRTAKNRGITIREAESLEDFHEFYKIYLQVFSDFGTPPYGANYFRILWQRLYASKNVRLILAYNEKRCVGGLILFCWKKNWVNKFAACLPEVVPLRTYVALYWRAIQLGLELGCKRLSWGTSSPDQTGLIEFKERWGAKSSPVVIYSLPVKGNVPSIEKYYDSNGLIRRIWKKLPIGVTSILGGPINRWFC